MGLDFYYLPVSSPCRAVLLAARTIGVELNLKPTNIQTGENKTPEYLEVKMEMGHFGPSQTMYDYNRRRMNPQHTIPTMDDDGFFMYESRPIIQYLANAYSQNENLYPTEPKARFLVDHRLAFDAGTLYKKFAELYYPIMFAGAPLDPAKVEALDEAMGFVEGFLGKTTYISGDNITIADFAFAATLSTIEAVGHDFSVFPALVQYMEKLKGELDGYAELNQEGADQFGAWFRSAVADA